jgi:hypothetical protein
MTSKRAKALLLPPLVTVEIVSAILAWRDLDQRPETAIRGRKKIWRLAVLANPGNSLAYWAFGRR